MKKSETFIYRRALQIGRINTFRQNEKEKGANAWYVYGQNYRDYERFFSLPENFLLDIVSTARKKRQRPFGLDLLSGTEMLESLRLPGLAVCLTDLRPKIKIIASKGLWETIALDAFSQRKQVWQLIRKKMVSLGHDSFDLITQRGRFGLTKAVTNPTHHFYHLQQMWSLLAENGIILTETTTLDWEIMEKHQLVDYWRCQGVGIESVEHGLLLQRKPGSPPQLSLNFQPSKQDLQLWYDISYRG